MRDGRLTRIKGHLVRGNGYTIKSHSMRIDGEFYNTARVAFALQYQFDPGPLCVVVVNGDASNLDAVNLVAVPKPQAMLIHAKRTEEIRKRCRTKPR
jgi:hypothetical protein